MTARVLVVDDILSNVKLLEAKLSAEYFEVITAFNGLECLARMEEVIPDIVLLDLRMPVVDGIGVAQWIKRSRSNARTVILTIFSSESNVRQAAQAGVNAYLLKDASPGEIFSEVRVPSFKQRAYLSMLSRIDSKTMAGMIQRIAETDLAIKTSKATPRMQMEMLVCELMI